ncbi:MAG: hypothetical protein Q7V01_10325, partial [Vicinamibacterales bacterium]|nr:hypothetical protein [Vicinamibacterales bacterium]
GVATAWTATADQPWVHISQRSATGAGRFDVSIINPGNVLGLSTNVISTITVAADGASNSPQSVLVELSLAPVASMTGPFGQIDTPLQNATEVAGAIGVTGWALDDVGVTDVRIYRNCLPFDHPGSCQVRHGASTVFVGDAAFLAGARPDVEAAFPTYPQAYRAGWGYLMLTNMLPHVTSGLAYGGQGTLQLYAIATDVEGKTTLLGRSRADHAPTSITLTNDTIAKPFGAIDTPGQGETVSGLLANFGWVLTRDGNTSAEAGDISIPTDGSTVGVFLDGVKVGQVAYNQCRGTVGNPVPAGLYCDDDVANIFGNAMPQATFSQRVANQTAYRNLDAGRAAIGSFAIDTTTLANGRHTIAWGVTDSAGRTEGIGSRFFHVLNSGADAGSVGDTAGQVPSAVRLKPDACVVGAGSSRSLSARVGFDSASAFEDAPFDAEGVYKIRLAELGRLELRLGTVEAGYLLANGARRELPPGSHLDTTTGVFRWAPGPGFFGTYRLVFQSAGAETVVDVTIGPDASSTLDEGTISTIRF